MRRDASVSDGNMDERVHMGTLACDAFTLFAFEANNVTIWNDNMALVTDTHRGLIWVTKNYMNEYI